MHAYIAKTSIASLMTSDENLIPHIHFLSLHLCAVITPYFSTGSGTLPLAYLCQLPSGMLGVELPIPIKPQVNVHVC